MPYKVAIKKNETGEIRSYEVEWDWFRNGVDGDLFWWTEGNFGCDCNRFLSFERASGVEAELEAVECSEGRYSALYAELPDGRRIEIDRATHNTEHQE